MQVCPQCQRDRLVNNGCAAGKPKKRCQQCGDQFTRTTPRGKPLTTKITAVLLSLSGISMHRIACRLRVFAQAGLNWIRTFAQKYQEQPEPTGRGLILELDELWHDVQKNRQQLGIWTALDQDPGQLLDWECGRRDKAPLKKMVDRLASRDVQVSCTDTWGTYASVIPQDNLGQRTTTTLTMALLARFWVNGNQDELLSLLGGNPRKFYTLA
jgi:IS1 family transposase/transposase-like protein